MQNAALATLALTRGLQTADDLAHRFLIADANILTSYRLTLDAADVLVRSDTGEFDVPRAREAVSISSSRSCSSPRATRKPGTRKKSPTAASTRCSRSSRAVMP